MEQKTILEQIKELPAGRGLDDEMLKYVGRKVERFEKCGRTFGYHGNRPTNMVRKILKALGKEFDVYGWEGIENNDTPDLRTIYIVKPDCADKDFLDMMEALGKTIIDCYRKPKKQ